ncbi:MAG: polymer-forming cytoskeletal protein [Balneolia bacterium]|nr:polymer-forming cytoskeletal protein [Balneolia bacterium]
MGKYSILLVLGLSVVMFTYSFLLRNTFFSGNERVVEMYEFNQAHNIAQGALMTVIRDLNNGESSIEIPVAGGSSSTGFSSWPDMMGDYNIDIRHDSARDLMIVESTGRFDGTEYTVTAGLRSSAAGFNWPDMDFALYTEDYLSINSGSIEGDIFSGGKLTVDGNAQIRGNATAALSGNSPLLDLGLITFGERTVSATIGSGRIHGDLYTNATNDGGVEYTNWSAEIMGNLLVGPGGNPSNVAPKMSLWHPGHVKGNQGSLNAEIPPQLLPMPVFPEIPGGLNTLLDVNLSGVSNQNIDLRNLGDAYIQNINISNDTVLNIVVGDQDRVLRVSNFNMPQGHLNIISEGSGNLQLIIDNTFTIAGSSSMNNNENQGGNSRMPQSLLLAYGGSQELSIGGDIPINANLYVESADLRLGNSGSLKGNIISGGENITIDGGSQNQSRLIYAPHANVTMGGSGTVLGAIAARSFSGSGGFKIDYSGDFENFLPELASDDDSGRFTIAFWN